MKDVNTIVVAVDFSDGSKAALATAARIAKQAGATLQVLHVIESLVPADVAKILPGSVAEVSDELTDRARKRLLEWLEDVERPAQCVADAVIGSPIDQILTRVRETEADLLVAGVHGLSGEEPGAGTTAIQCVRKAPSAVLLVNDSHRDSFRKIVACVDFSEPSRAALKECFRLARHEGVPVDAVHVFYGPWHHLSRGPSPRVSGDFQEQYKAALRGELEACCEEVSRDAGEVEVSCHLHDAYNYGRGIVDYATEVGADLVALGTKGTTNLRYVLLGSTAERVLRFLPCSVLAIKPPTE